MTAPTATPKSQAAARHLLAAADALKDYKTHHAVELVAGGYKPEDAEKFAGLPFATLSNILHGGK